MAGLSYVHNTEYGFLRTALAETRWITATALLGSGPLYRYTNGALTLTPGIVCSTTVRTTTTTTMVSLRMSPVVWSEELQRR